MEQILIQIDIETAEHLYKQLMQGGFRLENEGFSEDEAVYKIADLLRMAIDSR